jgi:hypothetical protein
MDMGRSRARRRSRAIADLVVTAYARDQVSKALYEAVLVGIACGPCDLPSSDDREWIRGAIAIPLQEATQAALDALRRSIDRALQEAPDGLLGRVELGHTPRSTELATAAF